jgi:transposase
MPTNIVLVKDYGVIVVGNVESKIVKTKMAKSVLDAGWCTFKTQLMYKSHRSASVFKEVNESHSIQDCSACGVREGPKGLEGLGVKAGFFRSEECTTTETGMPPPTFW